MLALAERHVGDFAEAGAIVVQRPDMAPVHVLGAAFEVVGAERGEAAGNDATSVAVQLDGVSTAAA